MKNTRSAFLAFGLVSVAGVTLLTREASAQQIAAFAGHGTASTPTANNALQISASATIDYSGDPSRGVRDINIHVHALNSAFLDDGAGCATVSLMRGDIVASSWRVCTALIPGHGFRGPASRETDAAFRIPPGLAGLTAVRFSWDNAYHQGGAVSLSEIVGMAQTVATILAL